MNYQHQHQYHHHEQYRYHYHLLQQQQQQQKQQKQQQQKQQPTTDLSPIMTNGYRTIHHASTSRSTNTNNTRTNVAIRSDNRDYDKCKDDTFFESSTSTSTSASTAERDILISTSYCGTSSSSSATTTSSRLDGRNHDSVNEKDIKTAARVAAGVESKARANVNVNTKAMSTLVETITKEQNMRGTRNNFNHSSSTTINESTRTPRTSRTNIIKQKRVCHTNNGVHESKYYKKVILPPSTDDNSIGIYVKKQPALNNSTNNNSTNNSTNNNNRKGLEIIKVEESSPLYRKVECGDIIVKFMEINLYDIDITQFSHIFKERQNEQRRYFVIFTPKQEQQHQQQQQQQQQLQQQQTIHDPPIIAAASTRSIDQVLILPNISLDDEDEDDDDNDKNDDDDDDKNEKVPVTFTVQGISSTEFDQKDIEKMPICYGFDPLDVESQRIAEIKQNSLLEQFYTLRKKQRI
jgi:hypothetical protein